MDERDAQLVKGLLTLLEDQLERVTSCGAGQTFNTAEYGWVDLDAAHTSAKIALATMNGAKFERVQ